MNGSYVVVLSFARRDQNFNIWFAAHYDIELIEIFMGNEIYPYGTRENNFLSTFPHNGNENYVLDVQRVHHDRVCMTNTFHNPKSD